MDFDSHTSDVVAATVAAINAVTPGDCRGRAYQPPTGADLTGPLLTALGPAKRRDVTPPLEQVRELGGYLAALRITFELLAAGDLDGACAHVNDLLSATGALPVLSRHDGERWHLHFHAHGAPWALSWAGSMATSLAVVLGGPSHDRLGVCRAPVCDRVYVDTSRNGTRRFCSTACQNRVKAAAFRERQRA